MSNELSHFDKDVKAVMVDISTKNETERTAVATGEIRMNPDTLRTIKEGNIKKGDVLGVARVAAIMASKNTYNAIPMCHNILLSSAKIEFEKLAVYLVEEGTIQDLVVKNQRIINTNALSDTINDIYDNYSQLDKNGKLIKK